MGSGIGGISTIEANYAKLREGGPRKISPFFVPGTIINMISGHVSIKYGLTGPNLGIVTACTTSTHCIGLAARLIQSGDADVMFAGGAEYATTPLGLGGFALRARCRRAMTIRRARAGRGIAIATASCSATAPAASRSRSTSTRKRAARESMRSSRASE